VGIKKEHHRGPLTGTPCKKVRWRQDNGNRSNQESKFDFLATHQRLVKIDEGQQKRKIVCPNQQSNLRGSCPSNFSHCWHLHSKKAIFNLGDKYCKEHMNPICIQVLLSRKACNTPTNIPGEPYCNEHREEKFVIPEIITKNQIIEP